MPNLVCVFWYVCLPMTAFERHCTSSC
jgi:hypothetical protein